MTAKQQELYNAIENLPDELASQVIDYMEYIKFMYVSNEAPDNLIIKDKEDLKKKLEQGIESTDKGEVYSIEEVLEEVQKL
jgi:hypothetical protein